MMHFVRGNLFDSGAQTLVNTVNCVGVMGKGIAKEFRDRWPEMFKDYFHACRRHELRAGHPHLWRSGDLLILNFPTKDNWKEPSKYEFIEAGLKVIRNRFQEWGIASMAFPPLGCGQGGLEWDQVKALMVKYLGDLPIPIEVFEPLTTDAKAGSWEKRIVQPVRVTLPLAIVGELIRRARKAMHPGTPLGKLAVQKLAFFAQFAGAPIRLDFRDYKYGPYDHNLNHMIERLEGLYIRDDSASRFTSNLVMLDEPAWLKDVEPWAQDLQRFDKYVNTAVELLSSRSTREIELLATVQYSCAALVSAGLEGTPDEIEEYVHNWKVKFSSEEIGQTMTILRDKGWLGPVGPEKPSPLIDPAPEPGEAVFS